MDTLKHEQKQFTKFVNELKKLSKKYGVAIQSTGGIALGEIEDIIYSNDFTSGDLRFTVNWKKSN